MSNDSFLKVKSWILDSGLVVDDFNNQNNGAVHSFYNSLKNEYGFLYPEITGYYVSTLRFLYNIDKNPPFC